MDRIHRVIVIIVSGLCAALWTVMAIIAFVNSEQFDTFPLVVRPILAAAWTHVFIRQMIRYRSGSEL